MHNQKVRKRLRDMVTKKQLTPQKADEIYLQWRKKCISELPHREGKAEATLKLQREMILKSEIKDIKNLLAMDLSEFSEIYPRLVEISDYRSTLPATGERLIRIWGITGNVSHIWKVLGILIREGTIDEDEGLTTYRIWRQIVRSRMKKKEEPTILRI